MDSFLVYDPERLKEVVEEWRSQIGWIDMRYAVKCNSLKCLLRDLDLLGCGFDVASQGELQKLIDLKVDPSKIIYSNPFKAEKQVDFAYKNGVRLTVADTIGELEKVTRIAPDMKILWRISVEEQKKAENIISFADKFGDPMNSLQEINKKFQNLYDKGYRLQGIHFHAGSGHEGSDNFQDYLRRARQCMFAAKQIGHPMEIMDIGGGFAGNYINQKISSCLQYTKEDPLKCEFIAEPGRYVASRPFAMGVRVIGKRELSENQVAIYVNDGIYHAFNKVSTDGVSLNDKRLFEDKKEQDQVLSDQENDDDDDDDFSKVKIENHVQEIKAVIYGHTCDGLDIVAKDVLIPEKIEIGDWLVFGGMGAYTHSLISQFNNMQSCTSILVVDDVQCQVGCDNDNSRGSAETLEQLSDDEIQQQQYEDDKEVEDLSKKKASSSCAAEVMDYSMHSADYITVPPFYNSGGDF